MPISPQASTQARVTGCGSIGSDTASGPSIPCHSPPRAVLPSERRKYRRSSANDQPGSPVSSAQRSKSDGCPRVNTCALIDPPPPSTRAWAYGISRPPAWTCGTVLSPQVNGPAVILANPAGAWIRRMPVRPARLEQQHPARRILAQPRRQHAARPTRHRR